MTPAVGEDRSAQCGSHLRVLAWARHWVAGCVQVVLLKPHDSALRSVLL